MPEIMETDMPQTVTVQQQLEMIRNVVRPEQLAHLVYTDIIQVIGAIRLFEQGAKAFLFFFLL